MQNRATTDVWLPGLLVPEITATIFFLCLVTPSGVNCSVFDEAFKFYLPESYLCALVSWNDKMYACRRATAATMQRKLSIEPQKQTFTESQLR
jgi:hypothetical protein